MCGEKTFKNLYKIIKESISCNVADLFYSKSTQRALGHSSHSGTRPPETLMHSKCLGNLGTQGTLGTWTLRTQGT